MQRGTARIALAVLALVLAVSVVVAIVSSEDDGPAASGEELPVTAVNDRLEDLPRGDRTPAELAAAIPDLADRATTGGEGAAPEISVKEENAGQRLVLTIVDRPLDDAVESVVYRLEVNRTTDGKYRARSLRRELTCRRGEDDAGLCL